MNSKLLDARRKIDVGVKIRVLHLIEFMCHSHEEVGKQPYA
jgi:hypothetical protein